MSKPSSKSISISGVLIWTGAAALLWMFVIGPWLDGPKFTQSGFDHLVGNLSEVKELFVEEDGRTVIYTLKQNGPMYRTTSPYNISGIVDNAIGVGAAVGAAPPVKPMGMGTMLMMSIIPVLILVGAMVWTGKKQSGGMMKFGKTKAKVILPGENPTRLTDVISNPGEHDEAKEIIDFLTRSEDYLAAKAEFPKGIMLTGPPGTGKTLLARAIAGEAGVPFFHISGSEFVEMFVGVGASRVRDLFEKAKACAPSIVFIDEIDAVGRERSGGGNTGGNDERGQTLNQLLVEMDGFENDTGVLVMAATNMPEVLDPALLRPGRFDRVIHITKPDVAAREAILNLNLESVNRDVNDDDVHQIAKGTSGFSGAELAKIVKEAAIFVAREKRTDVTADDLENARDKVIMGAESPKVMNPEEIKQTAYHEAGHAIVSHIVPDHDPVYKVSIVPRGGALGVTLFLPDEERYSHSFEHLNSMIATLYGGRVAEAKQFGDSKISTGAANDIERATFIARNMVTRWGFTSLGVANFSVTDHIGSSVFSDATLTQIDTEIREILAKNYARAEEILAKYEDKLKIMADALIEHETINREQIEAIMAGTTPTYIVVEKEKPAEEGTWADRR